MRPIDADALRDDLKESYDKLWLIYQEQTTLMDREICKAELVTFNEMLLRLKDAPTIDAVPVVRCKDCKHRYTGTCEMICDEYEWTADDGFCNAGERWEDDGK